MTRKLGLASMALYVLTCAIFTILGLEVGIGSLFGILATLMGLGGGLFGLYVFALMRSQEPADEPGPAVPSRVPLQTLTAAASVVLAGSLVLILMVRTPTAYVIAVALGVGFVGVATLSLMVQRPKIAGPSSS